jgi:hypothetical protein
MSFSTNGIAPLRKSKQERRQLRPHAFKVTLVEETGGAVKSLTLEDLNALGMTPTQACAKTTENLEHLLISGVIQMQLFGDHWGAAACILLPNLPTLAKNSLNTEEICLSIPHREALLIFGKEDRGHRDRMRTMIEEMEGNQPKPLMLGLFTFRADAPVALLE